jgi:hypothetical protein
LKKLVKQIIFAKLLTGPTLRSYIKAYLSSDFTNLVHIPASGSQIVDYDVWHAGSDSALAKVFMFRGWHVTDLCTKYNAMTRPDGTNVAVAWRPFDADGNEIFGSRSGVDLAQFWLVSGRYSDHPKN